MQQTPFYKSLLPHLVIIATFILVSLLYFSPVIDGKVLNQHDVTLAGGCAKEIHDYKKDEGKTPLWTNGIFSGMPAYYIAVDSNYNIFEFLNKILRLNLNYFHLGIMFLYLIGMYVFFLSLGINKWLSFIGALAFAFASYNLIIIKAGHTNKAYAIAYMAPYIAGVLSMYNRKYIIGLILIVISLGLQTFESHIQISYYTAILAVIIMAVKLIFAFKEKLIKKWVISTLFIAGSSILAILPLTNRLWSTYEYAAFTMRGGSDLKTEVDGKKNEGLDRDYALDWSYGKMETFTILIPNFYGGASQGGELTENSKTYKALKENNVPNAKKIAQQTPTYWGEMKFTSGPVYFGAIICFLFVLGLFVVKGEFKWWIVSAVALSILLAWGKHLGWFTDIFFYHFPMYNKFRTVSMILVITNLVFIIFAIYTLNEIIKNKNNPDFIKHFKKALYIIGGLLAVFILIPGLFFDFHSPIMDDQLSKGGYPDWLLDAIREDRRRLIQLDALRSLIFIGLAAGTIYLFVKNKIKLSYLYISIGLLILIDLWGVGKRYVNNDDFVSKKEQKNFFQPAPANLAILEDKNLSYRVFNLNNPWQESHTSYFHKSIGGYHAAKFARYQEMIDNQLSKEHARIIQTLQSSPTPEILMNTLASCNGLNMLNTKYIIINPQNQPFTNPFALGNSWFIDSITLAEDAIEEMDLVGKINPRKTAVIDKKFKEDLKNLQISPDSTATITLTSYHPDILKYQASVKQPQLAVFSEVYYDKGWRAFIDEKEVPVIRANYILRAIVVPEGNHKIEFRFEPRSYTIGGKISIFGSILIGLVLLIGTILFLKKNSNK